MGNIFFDHSYADPLVTDEEIEKFQSKVTLYHLLHDGDDEFSAYTGWIDWPCIFHLQNTGII